MQKLPVETLRVEPLAFQHFHIILRPSPVTRLTLQASVSANGRILLEVLASMSLVLVACGTPTVCKRLEFFCCTVTLTIWKIQQRPISCDSPSSLQRHAVAVISATEHHAAQVRAHLAFSCCPVPEHVVTAHELAALSHAAQPP